jgi:DNA polymerase-3 subunit alpha
VRPLVGLDKELNRNRIVNKSHAAAYAVISIRTAWLKYYYPVIFWTETLNSVINKSDKIRKYLYCAQKHGLHLMQPSVNNSKSRFSYDGNNIYIGLSAIRDLGKASLPIIEERMTSGNYNTFREFVDRCRPGKKVLSALAYAGGFDEFGIERKTVIENTENIGNYLNMVTKYDTWADFDEINDCYASLINLELNVQEEYPKQEKLLYEYNYAGMYISEHPLDEHMVDISILEPQFIVDLNYEQDENENVNFRSLDMDVKVIGILKDIEHKITRKGDTMIVGNIEDKTGSIRFTIFAKTLAEETFNKELLVENSIVILDGVRKVNDFGSQIVVSAVNNLTSYKEQYNRICCLTDMENYQQVIDVAHKCKPGNLIVILRIEFQPGMKATIYLDADSDRLYSPRDRVDTDPKNLRVDFADFMKLKEVSKRVSVVKAKKDEDIA